MKNKQVLMLSVALFMLLGYEHLAAWTAPPNNPPSGNVAAPINTSAAAQQKTGNLTVGRLTTPRVQAGQYCNQAGTQCVEATNFLSGGTDGLGYNQRWTNVSRAQWVWYHNNTPRPIMVFHKNYERGTIVRVGPTTTNYVILDFNDRDSDHDNGSTFIVPVGHWYLFETHPNQYGNVVEMR